MKKITVFVIVGVLLLIPMYAGAGLIGTGTLHMSYTNPTQRMVFPNMATADYYADYDAIYTLLGNGYTGEIFCVEDVYGTAKAVSYDFFTIDSSLNDHGVDANKYIRATWFANWFASQGTDPAKATAQVAIWEVVLESAETGYNLSSGNLQAIDGYMTAAQNLLDNQFASAVIDETWDDYAGNWMLAVSPPTGGGNIGLDKFQNYLVPRSVPEPATLLLLGTGLLGLAVLGRQRFK